MSKRKRQLDSAKSAPNRAEKKAAQLRTSKRNLMVFSLAFICVLGTCIYSNTMQAPLVFDDGPNIIENQQIQVSEFDLGQFYDAAMKSRAPRPLAYFTFALNYYFDGLNVYGYHLVNLLIHLANGILVYFLASYTYRLLAGGCQGKLDDSDPTTVGWLSLFAACLFVAHPLQTQAVTYIVQRMTSLSVLFYFLALLLYILGRLQPAGRQRWLLWAGVALAGGLAMASKQIAITLPVVILLYEWYFFRNLDKDWALRGAKYLVPLAFGLGLIALIFLGTSPWQKLLDGYEIRNFTMGERLLTQFRVIVFYISLVLLPLPDRLNLIHVVETSQSLFDPITTLLSLLVILGLIAYSLRVARNHRLASFCILWFFINLVVESSIIALEMIFEHRLYLPMFGVALLVPTIIQYLLARQPTAKMVFPCLLILLLGLGTYTRNQVWLTTPTLWKDVISKSPTSPRAHTMLGLHYRNSQNYQPALDLFDTALKLSADNTDIYKFRALTYASLNQFDRAIADFDTVIKLDPEDSEAYSNLGSIYRKAGKSQHAIDNYTKAIELDDSFYMAYYNRANLYQSQGKSKLALEDYNKAIEINPTFAPVYTNRGNIFSDQGDCEKAVEDYTQTIKHSKDSTIAYVNRGNCYRKQGKTKLAIADYQKAVQLQPNLTVVFENLAWLLSSSPQAEIRNGKLALQYAKKACQLTNWRNPNCLDALAASYAEIGNFSEAIKWQTKILEKAPEDLAAPLQQRLKLYQANQPFRQLEPK